MTFLSTAPAALFVSFVVSGCAGARPVPAHAGAVETSETTTAEVHTTRRTVLYAVPGESIKIVRRNLARIGPLDHGSHQSAFTWFEYAWLYPFAKTPDGCTTGPVRLELEVVQTFPEWEAPDTVAPVAMREWRRWLAATRAHEDEHVAIGMDVARQLETAMKGVSARTYTTCDDVDRAANEAGDAVLDLGHRRHRELDQRTKHGETSGAVLHDE